MYSTLKFNIIFYISLFYSFFFCRSLWKFSNRAYSYNSIHSLRLLSLIVRPFLLLPWQPSRPSSNPMSPVRSSSTPTTSVSPKGLGSYIICNKQHGPNFEISSVMSNLQTKQNKPKTQILQNPEILCEAS